MGEDRAIKIALTPVKLTCVSGVPELKYARGEVEVREGLLGPLGSSTS